MSWDLFPSREKLAKSVQVKVEKTQVLFFQQRKISHLIAVYNLEETWHLKLILKRIES